MTTYIGSAARDAPASKARAGRSSGLARVGEVAEDGIVVATDEAELECVTDGRRDRLGGEGQPALADGDLDHRRTYTAAASGDSGKGQGNVRRELHGGYVQSKVRGYGVGKVS